MIVKDFPSVTQLYHEHNLLILKCHSINYNFTYENFTNYKSINLFTLI